MSFRVELLLGLMLQPEPGVTARHAPNDNLGLVVEYASHVIFVPGNSSNSRSLI